jgi:hypothetical protein
VLRTLREALGAAHAAAEFEQSEPKRRKLWEKARAAARREFVDPPYAEGAPTLDRVYTVPFGANDRDAAEKAYALGLGMRNVPGILPDVRVLRTEREYQLRIAFAPAEPLRSFLASPQATHRRRVELIDSFVTRLEEWTEAGFVFTPDFVTLDGHFARIRDQKGSVEFVSGKLDALRRWEPAVDFLDPSFVESRHAASLVRLLYYGTCQADDVVETAIFREPWNDNVVLKLSEWMERTALIRVADLASATHELFRSELERSPLFIADVTSQFSRDHVDHGQGNLLAEMITVEATRWLRDSGLYAAEICFALAETAAGHVQLGLLPDANTSTFQLYRYIPYGPVRWSDLLPPREG